MKCICYDEFKCIADKCRFTCCEGWEIERSDSRVCMNMIKEAAVSSETTASLRCPLLKDGLCRLVSEKGEEYLPHACDIFPRNIYTNYKDEECFELSFACEAVVDLYNDIEYSKACEHRKKTSEPAYSVYDDIYGKVIDLLSDDSCPIDVALLSGYVYLNRISEYIPVEVYETQSASGYDEYLKKGIKALDMEDCIRSSEGLFEEIDPDTSFQRLCNLFMDVCMNYAELPLMKATLQDILTELENSTIDNKSDDLFFEFQDYKLIFDELVEREPLIKTVILEKISEAVQNAEDIYDIIQNMEVVCYEFAMLRIAMFLKNRIMQKNEEDAKDNYDYDKVRSLVVCISRMIGHNQDAFFDYLLDEIEEVTIDDISIVLS